MPCRIAFHPPSVSATFQRGLKPFAEAVARESGGAFRVDLFPDGALGGGLTTQLQLVESGGAEGAFVIPGFTPSRFPDNFIFGIPGLFNGVVEASLVFSRLVARNALRGYSDFFVVGAFCTEPFSLHAKARLTCLADLRGMRLRAANASDESLLLSLGADARVVPGDRIRDAIVSREIDGTTLHAGTLFDLGVAEVTRYDYFLRLGCAPLNVLMNRRAFDALPHEARVAIERFSGEWFARNFAENLAALNETLLARMRADPARELTDPTPADVATAERAFRPVVEGWIAGDPHRSRAMEAALAEVAQLRSAD